MHVRAGRQRGLRLYRGAGLVVLALMSGSALADVTSLASALHATLANHPAVDGKLAEVSASESGLSEARSQRLPTLSAQASRYAGSSRSDYSSDDLSNPVTLRVRQPLWTFGRIGSNIAVAEAEVNYDEANLLQVRRDLISETALAYADVLSAQARLEVASQNLRQLGTLSEQIERRARGGLASDADTRLARVRLERAQVQSTRFEGELAVALDALESLTREPSVGTKPIPDSLLMLPPADEYERNVLNNSAELRQGEWNVDRAEAESDQARASSMPTVYLQAEKFYDQPGLRDDNQLSVVLEADLEGLGFSTRYRASAAESRQQAARQDLRVTRIQLLRDTRRLRRLHELQLGVESAYRASANDLQDLLDSYQRQYESGSKSWLDVLNIQQELSDQRLELVQAESDRIRYALELQALSGELDRLVGVDA